MVAVLLMMWRLSWGKWIRLGDFISKILETGKINLEVENCKRSISFVGSLFLVVLVGLFEVAESLEICGILGGR